jgi:hypothetical protein
VLLPVLTHGQPGFIYGDLAGCCSGCLIVNVEHQGPPWIGNRGDRQGWMWLSCGLRERQKGCIAAIETEPTQRNNQRNENTENLKIQTSPFS